MNMPDPDPAFLVKFHVIAMGIWLLLAIPTVLVWKQSVLWVAVMSLYANFASHFSAYDAARAALAVKEIHGNS